MEKKIELNKNGVGRLVEYEPFLMPDKLELNFIAKDYDLSNAFVYLRNGQKNGKFKLTSPFRVDNDYLSAGYLNARVELYLGEDLAKRWDILPIKIIETPTGYEVKDYLGELEKNLADLTEKVAKLEKQHKIIL